MGDFDNLYPAKVPGRSWLKDRTPEQVAWLEELAAVVKAAGREPSWREVQRRFEARWPGEAPTGAEVLSRTIRNLNE